VLLPALLEVTNPTPMTVQKNAMIMTQSRATNCKASGVAFMVMWPGD
jgi:hypothetical protein